MFIPELVTNPPTFNDPPIPAPPLITKEPVPEDLVTVLPPTNKLLMTEALFNVAELATDNIPP